MVVYKLNNGQASNIRTVQSDYILKEDEMSIEGDRLPDANSLHSIKYLKGTKIQRIKDEARKRILALAPQWKQMNMMASALDVVFAMVTNTQSISAKELSKAKDAKKFFDAYVKPIRFKSDEIELMVMNFKQKSEVINFDITDDTLWNEEN